MDGEPGLGKETLDEDWPVLDTFEPVPDDRGEAFIAAAGGLLTAAWVLGDLDNVRRQLS